jgi:hypothetical protein
LDKFKSKLKKETFVCSLKIFVLIFLTS